MQKSKVLKFGGSSLANAMQIQKAAAIICAEPQRRYVVVSAPGKRFDGDNKVTDLLYQCADLAEQGADISAPFAQIAERFLEICQELNLSLPIETELATIRAAIQGGASRAYTASRGEYLSARLLADYLHIPFVDAAEVIFFDQAGKLDEEKSCQLLSNRLSSLSRAVIPGFYGSCPDGSVQTFSRGGSDISGAVVAKAVDASLYENWTDVSGMLMADPAIVEHPQVIPSISYEELQELADLGAVVMHRDAVAPVRTANIPIRIRNTNAPQDPGTLISNQAQRDDENREAITGVAGRTGLSTITIEKKNMGRGFANNVCVALRRAHLSSETMTAGQDCLSVVVPTAAVAHCRDTLTDCILRDAQADAVTIEDGTALLGVVGKMAGIFLQRLTAAVTAQNIDVQMVDRRSRENVLLGVREADYAQAFQAIYQEAVRC